MIEPNDGVDVPGLLAVGPVIVLTGPAARACLDAVLISARTRKLNGLPLSQTHHALAQVLAEAVAADGQTAAAATPAVPLSIRPTVTVGEAAAALGLSRRQTRRLAPRLGGHRVDSVFRIHYWRCDRSGRFIAHTAGAAWRG